MEATGVLGEVGGEELATKHIGRTPTFILPRDAGEERGGSISGKSQRRKGDGPEAVIPNGCEGSKRDFSRRSK